MTVYEAEVPGVGHKFELELDGGRRVVVLVHHDGKREVYFKPDPDADSEKLFSLSDKQARQFGSILEGSHFQPVELEEVQVPLGDAILEWIEVGGESPVTGEALADVDLRERTGASVIAIQRGEETLSNPGPETELREGDVLVALGTREEHRALEELLELE